jgi:hypothetical protein
MIHFIYIFLHLFLFIKKKCLHLHIQTLKIYTMIKKVIAPKRTGNPLFDKMSCPVDILPEKFEIHYKDFEDKEHKIELSTKNCFIQGDWVARRYTVLSHRLVCKELNTQGIKYKSIVYKSDYGIEIISPHY